MSTEPQTEQITGGRVDAPVAAWLTLSAVFPDMARRISERAELESHYTPEQIEQARELTRVSALSYEESLRRVARQVSDLTGAINADTSDFDALNSENAPRRHQLRMPSVSGLYWPSRPSVPSDQDDEDSDEFTVRFEGLPGLATKCWADVWDDEEDDYVACNEDPVSELGVCEDHQAQIQGSS